MCEPRDESTREVLGTAVTGAADSQTTTFTSSSSQNIVPDFLTSSTSVEWNDPLSEGGFGDVLQSAQDDPSGRNLFSELCGPQQLSADQVEKFLNETNTSAQYVDSALDPSIEESINSMLRDNDPMLTSTSVENFKLDIGVFDNPSEGLSLVNPEPGITADINPDTFLKDLNDVSGSSQTENKMEAMPTRRSPRVAGIAPTTVAEEETKAQGDKVDTPPQKKGAEQKNLRRSSRIQRKDDSGDGVTPSPRTRGRAAKSSPQVQKTPPMARRTRASAMIAQTEAPVMESDTATTGEESFQSPPRTRRQAAAKSSPAKKTAITPKRAAALLQKAGSTVVKKTPPPSKESASPPTLKESPSASKETEVPPQDISAEGSQEASQETPSTPQKTVGATQETPTTPQQTQVVSKTQVTPSKTQITPMTQVTPSTTCKETPVEETAVSETDAPLEKSAALQEPESLAETSVGVTEKTAAATEEDQGKEETESSPNNTRKSSRIQVKEKEEAERVELDRVRMLDHDYAQPVAEKLAAKKKGGKSAEDDDATSSSIDQEPSELKSESTEDTESKTTTPKRGGRKKGAKKVDEDKKEQGTSEETKEDTEEENDGEKGGRKKATTPAKKQQERTPKRAATSKKGAATKSPKDTPPSAKKAKRKSEVSESEEEDLPLKRLMEEMHKEKAQEVIAKQQKQMKKPERKRRKSSVQIVEVEEPILFTPDNAAPLVKEEEVKGHGKKDGGPEEEAPTNKEGVKPKEIKTVKTEKPSTSTKEERRKSLDKEDTKKVAKDKERQRKDSVKSEKSDKEHQGDESGAESDDSGMTFSDDPNDSDWEDEDPDKAYCICRKPHGKRFMICCDRCEEWYHGDCVGITKKEGIRLEKNSEDYICPRCKEKDAKEKAVAESEPKGEQDKEGSDDASTSKKMKSREEHSKTGKAAKKDPSKKGEEGSETLKRQKSKEEEKESEKESPTAKKKKIKIFKEKYHPRQKCIGAGCSNWAQRGSVYCSNNCILSHARESLKLINKEKQKYGLLDAHAKKDPKASPVGFKPTSFYAKPDSTSYGHHKKIPTSPPATSTEKGKKDPERVAVIERSTGRLLAGLSAPTEDNLSQWLETHPTYEVLRPEVKQTQTYGKEAEKGKKGQSSKPIELDPVRLNVRRALKDLLKDRQDKCETMKKKRSPEDIMKAASAIETELHKLYNDTGTRYKSKYRSLMFNLKDARNTTLFKRVLTGEIRPHKLVKMSPEELACKELAQWRDRETKHTLEMIVKKEQEEAQMEKHLTKKTHKGEIEIDDDLGELKTEKSDEKEREEGYIPATAEAEGPDVLATMLVDTTEQHRAHLFDLNCKICTGRMAPPTDEQPAKKVKVAKTVIEASSTTKPDESSTAESPGPTVDTTTGSPTDPLVQSDTEDSSPDSAMPSQSELPSSKEPSVWKGFIKMEQLTKFVTHAYPVSGSMEDIQEDLPDTIMISGRISHSHIWEYLDKIKSSGNKEISIIRFQPAVDEEKVGYIMLYSYFHSRQRFGVVGNNSRQVKDMYLIPLPSHEEVPYQLKPFDGPGLEEPRPHMLLGLIIRNRMAKRSASSSSESTPLHASPKHRRYSEISGTPPSAGSPSVASGSKHRHHHHHHHHRRHHSQEHDRKQQVEQKKEEPKRKSETATPVPAKKVYTIPEHEISDPIVKQYANVDPSALIPRTSQDEMEEMPYSPGQAAQEEEEEQPYDPGDEDFLPVEEGVDSPPPQSPPAQQDSDSDSVLEVGIGQSDSNEASASQSEPSLDNILMTPLGDNPTLSEQQRLLIELTKQVEEQKKLLLEQQKNLESICSGPNSATGSPVVEFPTGDAKTVSTVGENIRVTVTQVLTTVASTQAVSSATASSSKTAAAEKKTDTASSVSTSGKVEGSDSPELPMIPGLGGDLTPPVNIPGLGGTSVGTAVATNSASSSAVQEKAEEKTAPSRPKEKVSETVSKLTSSGAAGASTSGSFEIPANISELLQKVSSIVKQTSQATTVVTQQPLVQQAQIPQAGLSGYLPQMSQIPSTGFQQAPGEATQAPIGQQIPGAPIGSFGGTWTANQSTAQTGQQYMPPQSAPEGQVRPTGQPAPAVGERRSDDPGREHGHHHGDSRQPSGPYPGYDPRNVQRFEYNEQGRQVRRDSGDDRHHRDRWHDRRDDRRDSRRDDRRDDHREERRGSRDHGWGREGGRDRERERDRDRDRDRWRQDRNTRDKGRGGQWQDSHRRR
ncbi:PHF3 [Branchiostoma lanceolatum]|uniref:PHF3 protein n=1 Tax=Branchiostoma lanceolatum TaxID=7740 RepID=A0A8J9Z6Z1_BRALA|nr:PHF3 [Branchiostoma lanceolatum]